MVYKLKPKKDKEEKERERQKEREATAEEDEDKAAEEKKNKERALQTASALAGALEKKMGEKKIKNERKGPSETASALAARKLYTYIT